MWLYLHTMVRKSDLQDATWDEVDFENGVLAGPSTQTSRSTHVPQNQSNELVQ